MSATKAAWVKLPTAPCCQPYGPILAPSCVHTTPPRPSPCGNQDNRCHPARLETPFIGDYRTLSRTGESSGSRDGQRWGGLVLLVGLPDQGAHVRCLPPRTHHPKEPTSRTQRPQVPTPGTPPPGTQSADAPRGWERHQDHCCPEWAACWRPPHSDLVWCLHWLAARRGLRKRHFQGLTLGLGPGVWCVRLWWRR